MLIGAMLTPSSCMHDCHGASVYAAVQTELTAYTMMALSCASTRHISTTGYSPPII